MSTARSASKLRPPTPIKTSEALEATLKKLELGNDNSSFFSQTQTNLHSRRESRSSLAIATTPRVHNCARTPV